jgi:hypothetical protein
LLLLNGLKTHLKAADTFPSTIEFEKSGSVELEIRIERSAETGRAILVERGSWRGLPHRILASGSLDRNRLIAGLFAVMQRP